MASAGNAGAADEIVAMLELLAAAPSRYQQEAVLWQHPRLLEPGIAEELDVVIASRSQQERAGLRSALEYIRDARSGYERTQEGYPVFLGPIEQVWRRVSDLEISPAEGTRLVGERKFLASLSSRYLIAASDFARDVLSDYSPVFGRGAESHPAVQMHRLVQAAVDAFCDESDEERLRAETAIAWGSIVRARLATAPDPGILWDAEARAKQVLARLPPHGYENFRARLLFELGMLFLDPYTATRSPARSADNLTSRAQRADLDVLAADMRADEPAMPEPLEALRKAEDYLRRSADLATGSLRVRALKALGQALESRADFGGRIDRDELEELAAAAAAELAGNEFVTRLQMLAKRAAGGEEIAAAELGPVLERTPDQLEREWGAEVAAGLVADAVKILSRSDPRRALDLLRGTRHLFRHASEAMRIRALRSELSLLTDAFAPMLPTRRSIKRGAKALRKRAEKERWSTIRTGAALLRLALEGATSNAEQRALLLLDEVVAVSPVIAHEQKEAISLFRALLMVGEAVNAYNARAWRWSAVLYGYALAKFIELGLDGSARDILARLYDVAPKADASIAGDLALALLQAAPQIEARLGEVATVNLLEIVNAAIVSGVNYSASGEAFHYLWQVAKGARLAPVLTFGSGYTPTADSYARHLIDRIRAAEAGLPAVAAVASQDPLLDEEMILHAYSGPSQPDQVSTPEARFASLQYAFDEHITARLLLDSAGGSNFSAVAFEALKPALGERTVLLDVYLGASPKGGAAVYIFYVVGDEVGVTVTSQPSPPLKIGLADILTSDWAFVVRHIREGVQDPPLGRRPVSRAAQGDLDVWLRQLLGRLSERLDDFRRDGRDHLCIVPHGPLHFFPFHLLGRDGHPLAEDFAVTYLPHLHLLGAGRYRRANTRPLSAFALGFADDARPGLAPLPEAVAEARDIAALFATEATVEEAATRSAVAAGLASSRYVHIATHGRHNVYAPAFQCLYLAPSHGSDGRLFAHEIIGLDLHGVSLVTLSACETSLGRFDLGDNLRGLPASFFIAGVTTVVGTLWRVKDEVSRSFFVAFYKQLHSRMPMLEAFVFAQRATRDAFPQYRDWGAFYFAGDWGERKIEEEVT